MSTDLYSLCGGISIVEGLENNAEQLSIIVMEVSNEARLGSDISQMPQKGRLVPQHLLRTFVASLLEAPASFMGNLDNDEAGDPRYPNGNFVGILKLPTISIWQSPDLLSVQGTLQAFLNRSGYPEAFINATYTLGIPAMQLPRRDHTCNIQSCARIISHARNTSRS